jgi:hypothetical protein
MNVPAKQEEKLTKDEMIDIANITMVRFMYYAQEKRVPAICATLGLSEKIVLQYLSTKYTIPKDETLAHIVDFVSYKIFNVLGPFEKIMEMLYDEIMTKDAEDKPMPGRNDKIKSLSSIAKTYQMFLELLKKTHSIEEAGTTVNFGFNIVDNHGVLQQNSLALIKGGSNEKS